jgi:hypothetical protein
LISADFDLRKDGIALENLAEDRIRLKMIAYVSTINDNAGDNLRMSTAVFLS